MKSYLVLTVLALAAAKVSALPKLGFYKSYYSANHGTYGCALVTSNTKQVKIGTRKVTYFEFVTEDGVALTCIPQVFSDTDDVVVDGDPARMIFTSLSTAMCSTAGGVTFEDVEFDSAHVFWGGMSYGQVVLPDGAIAIGMQKERQTNYAEFFSTNACSP